LAVRACTTEPLRHSAFTSIAETYISREYLKKNENGNGRFPANLLASDDVLGDSCGYSRFFSLDTWAERNLPFLIAPKASKREKDAGIEGGIKEIDTRTPTANGSMAEKGLQPGKNIHPTVKPLKLMAYLITMGCREGNIVLDPFCGSGTTCIAAMMLKRDFIGIEISTQYHEIALKRLEHFRRKKAA
jgi:DNA modification methylase